MPSPLLALCTLGLAAAPWALAGQDTPSPLGRADHAILLGVGETTSMGYSTRVGERTDLGVEVGFSFAEQGDDDLRSIAGSVALKRYWSPATSPVAPYAIVGLHGSTTDVLGTDSRRFGVSGGIGLDWFPADRVSVGGHLALRASRTRLPSAGFPGDSETENGWEFRSVSSGIRLQLYF